MVGENAVARSKVGPTRLFAAGISGFEIRLWNKLNVSRPPQVYQPVRTAMECIWFLRFVLFAWRLVRPLYRPSLNISFRPRLRPYFKLPPELPDSPFGIGKRSGRTAERAHPPANHLS